MGTPSRTINNFPLSKKISPQQQKTPNTAKREKNLKFLTTSDKRDRK